MITQPMIKPSVWELGTGGGGDVGIPPNSIAISAYADRSMGDGETLWVQTAPVDFTVDVGAPLSTATSGVASTGCTIDILHNAVVVGSVTWEAGQTVGVFTWSTLVTFLAGDTISFVVTVADFTMTDFTVQLIGDLI